MAKTVIGEVDGGAWLYVRAETSAPLNAVFVGKITDRLGNLFRDHVRRYHTELRGADLAPMSLRSGSVFLDLAVLGQSLIALADAKDALAGLIANLNDTIGYLLNRHGGAPSSAEKSTIGALAKPVAAGDAVSITITVNGSNNAVIVDSSNAQQLLEALQRPNKRTDNEAEEDMKAARYKLTYGKRSPIAKRSGSVGWTDGQWGELEYKGGKLFAKMVNREHGRLEALLPSKAQYNLSTLDGAWAWGHLTFGSSNTKFNVGKLSEEKPDTFDDPI